jgi:hypothetical protein
MCYGDGGRAVPEGDVTTPEQQAVAAAERFWASVKAARMEDAAADCEFPWYCHGNVLPADRRNFEQFLDKRCICLPARAKAQPDVVEVVSWPKVQQRKLDDGEEDPDLDALLDPGAYVVYVGNRGEPFRRAIFVVFRRGQPRIAGVGD